MNLLEQLMDVGSISVAGLVAVALIAVAGVVLVGATIVWGGADRRVVVLHRVNLALMAGLIGLGMIESRSWTWGGTVILGNPTSALLLGLLAHALSLLVYARLLRRSDNASPRI